MVFVHIKQDYTRKTKQTLILCPLLDGASRMMGNYHVRFGEQFRIGLTLLFFMVLPGLVGGFGNKTLNFKFNTIKRQFNINTVYSETQRTAELRAKIGPYLAGLIEADGTFAIHDKESKAKKYNPKIAVVFNIVDEPLALKLANVTRAGTIYKKKEAGHVL